MTVRPQSQPASTTEGAWQAGLGPSTGHESSMRPRTAQPPMRLPIAPAQEPFQAPASRPQSVQAMRPKDSREPVAMFDAAVRAKTPPWVFKVSTDITNLMLKEEYEAMIVKQRQDENFNQKMNNYNPAPVQEHMKKDWRYYQHCGSKGNVWADLHMTPEDRRHLVVTPTVLKGYDQQMRTVQKHLRTEHEDKAARMERIVYERQARRFRLTEQQRERETLEERSSQRRPSYFSRASQPRESEQPLHSESRPATSLSLCAAAAPHQLRASTAGSSRSHTHHPHLPPRPATSHSVPDARELSIDGAKTLLGSTLGVPKLSGISAFESPGGLHAQQQKEQQQPKENMRAAAPEMPVPPLPSHTMYGVDVEYPPDYDFMLGRRVTLPASNIQGMPFQHGGKFGFTTLLSEEDWVRASSRREETKARGAWAQERPDLGAWAIGEAEKKAALELKYLETQRCVLLARRQERRCAFNERKEDRAALERDAGQDKVRQREAELSKCAQDVRQRESERCKFAQEKLLSSRPMPVWRPSA